jgi:hypothetical protein
MKPRLNVKMFVFELLVYTALVLTYFGVVLHYLGHWLEDIFDHDRTTYAMVAILLMVGQAVVLEMISSLLFFFIRKEEK